MIQIAQSAGKVWAVVPAAGTGSRMGTAMKKQFMELEGVPILARTITTLDACPAAKASVPYASPHPAGRRHPPRIRLSGSESTAIRLCFRFNPRRRPPSCRPCNPRGKYTDSRHVGRLCRCRTCQGYYQGCRRQRLCQRNPAASASLERADASDLSIRCDSPRL